MTYLLRLEWKKQYRSIPFWIFTGAYAVLLPTLLLLGKQLEELPPPLLTNEVLFIFPTVWEYLGYVGNWLSFFFLGFLAITTITSEYAYRTMRQNIIDGLDRRSYFFSKSAFITIIALIATFYYALCALTIGYFNTESIYWHKIWQNVDYLWRFFLMSLGYMSFGLLLGFLVKRTGVTLFLYFSYIMFIEVVLRWGVHYNLYQHPSMHYYPINAFADLIPEPFAPQADRFLQQAGFSLYLPPDQAVLFAIFYILIFFAIAFRRVLRADL